MQTRPIVAAVAALAVLPAGTATAETTATCHFEVRLDRTASGFISRAQDAVCAGILGARTAIPGVKVRVEGTAPAGSACAGPVTGRVTLLTPAPIDFGPTPSFSRLSLGFITHGHTSGGRLLLGSGESDVDRVAAGGSTTFVPDSRACDAGGRLMADIVLTSAGPRPPREATAAPAPGAAARPDDAKPRRTCKRRSAGRPARCARRPGRRS